MIHNDKDKFSKLVERIASQTGFYAPLMEKDYYMTILLNINLILVGRMMK